MSDLKKIMLIDDDPSITSLLKNKLEKTGKFTVVFTNDSTQAFRVAKEEKPDLIICDVDMPNMDGGDVRRKLSDSPDTNNIPVLFLSSLISKADQKKGLIGGQHMMSKSSNIKDLVTKIESMLNDYPELKELEI